MGGLHWLHSEVYCFRGPHWPHSSTLTLENTYSQEGVYTGYIQRSTVPEAHTGLIPRHLIWMILILKKGSTLATFRGLLFQRPTLATFLDTYHGEYLFSRRSLHWLFVLKKRSTLATFRGLLFQRPTLATFLDTYYGEYLFSRRSLHWL